MWGKIMDLRLCTPCKASLEKRKGRRTIGCSEQEITQIYFFTPPILSAHGLSEKVHLHTLTNFPYMSSSPFAYDFPIENTKVEELNMDYWWVDLKLVTSHDGLSHLTLYWRTTIKKNPHSPEEDIIFNIPCIFYSQNSLRKSMGSLLWILPKRTYLSIPKYLVLFIFVKFVWKKITFQFIIIFLSEWAECG
jgi:hypothetical protein